jgi:nucleoside-diphosphate-sugar epimerase
MRILFTGISSFTGYWFAKSLSATGHEVVGTMTARLERYEGVRRRRLDQLNTPCRLAPETPFGSEAFGKLIRDSGPWDLLCHHAAEATNYRSPDFDIHRALLSNSLNLRPTLAALKSAGLKGVVLTGSVFENDEGTGNEPLRAFSPYGLAKALTWQVFRFYCEQAAVPLGKFVIPNPFGPFEEPRFTAYLMNTWKQQQVAKVKTPDYVRDNIHVDLLTAVYVQFCELVAAGSDVVLQTNPSGYTGTQGGFASQVADEVRKRMGWPCALELGVQEDFNEPLARTNTESATAMIPNWNEQAAWDAFVEYYR